MKFRSTIILTPYDNPIDYEPDWRHNVAKVIAEESKGVRIPRDSTDIIVDHARFLSFNKLGYEIDIPKKYIDNKIVFNLYADDMDANYYKHYIESLLLTDVTYKHIGDLLGLSARQVRLYENLFYNVRNEDGSDKGAKLLKQKFVGFRLSGTSDSDKYLGWKVAASTLGYAALMALWNMAGDCDRAELQNAKLAGVDRVSMTRIMSGEISNFDINGIFKNYNDSVKIANDKELADKSPEGKEKSAVNSAWYRLLMDLGPRMVDLDDNPEVLEEQQKALEAKFKVQKDIEETKVEDKGNKAINEFNTAMQNRLKEEVKT